MDGLTPQAGWRFDRFVFHPSNGGLFRLTDAGAREPVPMGGRSLDVLAVLVARSGELVLKQTIMDAAWPGLSVEEKNLAVQISNLRRVLDEGRSGASCIQTVAGRGYQFTAEVSTVAKPQAGAVPSARQEAEPRPKRPVFVVVAGIAVASLLLVAGIWALERVPPPSAALQAGLDRRQSVIVLPFENSSGDPSQDDLAAGLTGDLTDRIALGRNGPVVPAMTARAYRGAAVDLREIGLRYDVHFAMVGNVRRQAGHVIVAAHLYTVVEGEPIWSRQFDVLDGPGSSTTLMQRVYEGYWQATVDAEAARALRDHPDRLDKRDLISVALSTRLATSTRDHYLQKMSLIDRVLAIDPDDIVGLERRARFHAEFVMSGFSSDPEADLASADEASGRLLALDSNHLLALRARTSVLRARGDWQAAEAVVRRAIALQPTEAGRHSELGYILMGAGRHREALQSYQAAARFAGGADPVYTYDAGIAMANLAIGEFAEAIVRSKAAISGYSPHSGRFEEAPWLALIAAMSSSDQTDEAQAMLRRFLATPRHWNSLAQVRKMPSFAANRELLDGLLRAGMPAE